MTISICNSLRPIVFTQKTNDIKEKKYQNQINRPWNDIKKRMIKPFAIKNKHRWNQNNSKHKMNQIVMKHSSWNGMEWNGDFQNRS
jgi:hypothetical protein